MIKYCAYSSAGIDTYTVDLNIEHFETDYKEYLEYGSLRDALVDYCIDCGNSESTYDSFYVGDFDPYKTELTANQKDFDVLKENFPNEDLDFLTIE